MAGGHPNQPTWSKPRLTPTITVRERGNGANREIETVIPAEIVKQALGSATHPTPPRRHGDTLYALGGGRQIRWNLAGDFAALYGVIPADLEPHVRRWDADDLAELFEAGPWDEASALSREQWSKIAAAFSAVLGRTVEVDEIAPWELNPPRPDGEVHEITGTVATRRPSTQVARELREGRADERQTAMEAEAADIRKELALRSAADGLAEVKREIADRSRTPIQRARERLRRR